MINMQTVMLDQGRKFNVDGTQSTYEIHDQIINRAADIPAFKCKTQGIQQNKFFKPIRIAISAVTKRNKM